MSHMSPDGEREHCIITAL